MEAALIGELARALTLGIEPGLSQDGVLQLYLTAESGREEAWFVSVDAVDGVTSGPGEHPDAIAAMHLDSARLAALQVGAINLRDALLAADLRLAGDLAFMQEIVSACSRPDPDTVRVLAAAEARARLTPAPVVRMLENPAPEAVLAQIRASLPCVFRGILGWDALGWTFEHIRDRYGKEVFRPGADGGEPLSVLMSRLLRGDRVYSYGCAVPEAMRHEFPFPVFDERDLSPKQLWLGTASPAPVTGLHRDARPVLLAQVLGRKRVVLYPAHQSPALYPRRAHNTYYQQCWVDPEAPDLARFPRFPEATPLPVDLLPGEILYIPTGWYHYVFALDDVMSVSTILSSGLQTLEAGDAAVPARADAHADAHAHAD